MKDRDKITNTTINLGLGSNILLSIFKTFFGIFGNSPALLADGINSTSDVIYYVAVKIFMHHARKPADDEHPYGHRQLESISAIVVGAFILTTGVAIFWESINKIYEYFSTGKAGNTISIAVLYIAVFTFCLKIFLFVYTRRTGKKTKNPTIRALANDHLNDIMAALAVVFGVVMNISGYYWVDPAAGALVAVYILKTGIEIIKDSSSDLMDAYPDEDFKQEITKISKSVVGVLEIEELGIHRFGPYYSINITIAVDGNISIREGHCIADRVESLLIDQYPESLRDVLIHYHPHNPTKGNCQWT